MFEQFAGAFTENYVAQELVAAKGLRELFYWTSSNQAEVDFLVPYEDDIYPLEVKSGLNPKAKNLRVYAGKFNPRILSTASPRNLKLDQDHCNIPLYAISRFPRLVG